MKHLTEVVIIFATLCLFSALGYNSENILQRVERKFARVGHLTCDQIINPQDRTKHLCNRDSDCEAPSKCVQDDCIRVCKRPLTLRDTGTWIQCDLLTGLRIDPARLNQDCGGYCRDEAGGGYTGGYCYPGQGTYWMGYCWCY